MVSRACFLIPCYVDELWPRAARAAVELAEAVDIEVSVSDAVCCGQALANAGEAGSDAMRGRVLEAASGFDELVVLSASCGGFLREAGRAHGVRVREWCDWFADYAPDQFPKRVDRRVALHSSCSALRSTESDWAARDLLSRVDGLVVTEPSEHDECCGFGGSFSTEFAELSIRMGSDKLAALHASNERGIDGVVSADCSCLLHLKALEKNALPCFHVAELLREAA